MTVEKLAEHIHRLAGFLSDKGWSKDAAGWASWVIKESLLNILMRSAEPGPGSYTIEEQVNPAGEVETVLARLWPPNAALDKALQQAYQLLMRASNQPSGHGGGRGRSTVVNTNSVRTLTTQLNRCATALRDADPAGSGKSGAVAGSAQRLEDSPWVTVTEAAALTDSYKGRVTRLAKSGKVHSMGEHKTRRVNLVSLMKYLHASRRDEQPESDQQVKRKFRDVGLDPD